MCRLRFLGKENPKNTQCVSAIAETLIEIDLPGKAYCRLFSNTVSYRTDTVSYGTDTVSYGTDTVSYRTLHGQLRFIWQEGASRTV